MASAQDVLKVAAKQLGVHENPVGSNRTKYGEWYGLDGYAWCAMFVSWVLDRCGVTRWKHSYTPSGINLFKTAGRWHTEPKPGDLVYFNFDSDVGPEHVGFVVKDNGDGTITTIEGNTSPTSAGSQANGDGVYQKVRAKSLILGYGRPDYEAAEKPQPSFDVTAIKVRELTVTKDELPDTLKDLKAKGFLIAKRERVK